MVPIADPGLVSCLWGCDPDTVSFALGVASPFFELGQPEVQDFRLPGRRHEDIAPLDVAVQNALSVRRVQRIRYLHPEVQQLGVRHGPMGMDLVQALPLQQLHYDKGLIVTVVQLIDSADTRMVQRRGSARFSPKAFQHRRVLARGFGQQLQGNRPPQLLVFSLVDHTHSTPAKPTDDPVVAQQRAGSQFLHATIMQPWMQPGKPETDAAI